MRIDAGIQAGIAVAAVLAGTAVAGLIVSARSARNAVRARWTRRPPPLSTVLFACIAVVAATVGLALAGFGLSGVMSSPPPWFPVGVVVLAVLAAVMAALTWHRISGADNGQFLTDFSSAAGQLGSPDAALRLAGAYALASLADKTSSFERRQQCIDVLCAFLRLPPGRTHIAEVRKTVLDIIIAHLRTQSPVSWSAHDFDFSRAELDDADFSGAEFAGQATSFDDAMFGGTYCSFVKVKFTGRHTSFVRARFKARTASFGAAVFAAEQISFARATFYGQTTMFAGARFESGQVSFARTSFAAQSFCSFTGAFFGGAAVSFADAAFGSRETAFDRADFGRGRVTFVRADFTGDRVSFAWPRRWGSVEMDWDGRPTLMPAQVRPRLWPPALASEGTAQKPVTSARH